MTQGLLQLTFTLFLCSLSYSGTSQEIKLGGTSDFNWTFISEYTTSCGGDWITSGQPGPVEKYRKDISAYHEGNLIGRWSIYRIDRCYLSRYHVRGENFEKYPFNLPSEKDLLNQIKISAQNLVNNGKIQYGIKEELELEAEIREQKRIAREQKRLKIERKNNLIDSLLGQYAVGNFVPDTITTYTDVYKPSFDPSFLVNKEFTIIQRGSRGVTKAFQILSGSKEAGYSETLRLSENGSFVSKALINGFDTFRLSGKWSIDDDLYLYLNTSVPVYADKQNNMYVRKRRISFIESGGAILVQSSEEYEYGKPKTYGLYISEPNIITPKIKDEEIWTLFFLNKAKNDFDRLFFIIEKSANMKFSGRFIGADLGYSGMNGPFRKSNARLDGTFTADSIRALLYWDSGLCSGYEVFIKGPRIKGFDSRYGTVMFGTEQGGRNIKSTCNYSHTNIFRRKEATLKRIDESEEEILTWLKKRLKYRKKKTGTTIGQQILSNMK